VHEAEPREMGREWRGFICGLNGFPTIHSLLRGGEDDEATNERVDERERKLRKENVENVTFPVLHASMLLHRYDIIMETKTARRGIF
jgi:hypothetical protein